LDEVAGAFDGRGDAGFGLNGRFPLVLDAVAPTIGFLGSVFPGETAGRGESLAGVPDDDAGSFLLDSDRLGGTLSIPFGVPRSRVGFAIISSSKLSSAASASSIALGRVGLRSSGNGGRVGVAGRLGGVRRGGVRRDGVRRDGGGLRRGGGGRCRGGAGGGDMRCRFTGRVSGVGIFEEGFRELDEISAVLRIDENKHVKSIEPTGVVRSAFIPLCRN